MGKAKEVNKSIVSSDAPIGPRNRERAKKSMRDLNKMEEGIEDSLKQFRTLGFTPEKIRRIEENATKFALFATAAVCLGGAYVAYRVLWWAWRTFWVRDQDPAVAEWEKSNDIRKL